MATPSKIIHVPKPASGSFNKSRPLAKNTLLLSQVRHFQEVEKKLPPEKRTGVDPAAVMTEGHASEYIRKMMTVLHPKVAKTGGK